MANINIPPIETGDAYGGLLNVYRISGTGLKAFNKFLWSKDFFDSLIKTNSNPIDNIVSCHRLPFLVSADTAESKIIVGNVVTSVLTNKVINTWQEKKTMTYTINRPFNDYRDYMCKISLYLPFVGNVNISPSDLFVNTENSLYITYRINVVSGGFVAFLVINDTVIGQYSGNCSLPLPTSGTNYSSVINNAISNGMSTLGSLLSIPINPVGGTLGAVSGVMGSLSSVFSGAPTSVKANIDSSNSFGIYPTPYLRIYKPRRIDNPQKKFFTGLPSGVGVTALSQCVGTGLVKTLDFKFSGSGCTDWEKSEVERILNNEGVIL